MYGFRAFAAEYSSRFTAFMRVTGMNSRRCAGVLLGAFALVALGAVSLHLWPSQESHESREREHLAAEHQRGSLRRRGQSDEHGPMPEQPEKGWKPEKAVNRPKRKRRESLGALSHSQMSKIKGLDIPDAKKVKDSYIVKLQPSVSQEQISSLCSSVGMLASMMCSCAFF